MIKKEGIRQKGKVIAWDVLIKRLKLLLVVTGVQDARNIKEFGISAGERTIPNNGKNELNDTLKNAVQMAVA